MLYITLDPAQADPLQEQLEMAGWQVISKDGGQSQFVGWAYVIHYQMPCDEDRQAEVWVHYSDNQGRLESYCELNPAAKPLLDALLKTLPENDH